nr:hypothetical protein [Tanacetum cinerariifolium]
MEIFQRVEALVDDSQYHYETGGLVDQEARYLGDVAEEEALTILEGVNTRVTELAVVQEQDTQDIYRVMEDNQGRQMEIFQRVEALDQRIDAHDTLIATLNTQLSSLQGYLATALGEIRALQAREQARAARDANRTVDDSHTSG